MVQNAFVPEDRLAMAQEGAATAKSRTASTVLVRQLSLVTPVSLLSFSKKLACLAGHPTKTLLTRSEALSAALSVSSLKRSRATSDQG